MKKVVYFRDCHEPVVGQCILVLPINHPDTERVSNKQWAITSPVVRVFEDGGFETQNTVYQYETVPAVGPTTPPSV